MSKNKKTKAVEDLVNEYDMLNLTIDYSRPGLVVFENKKIKITYSVGEFDNALHAGLPQCSIMDDSTSGSDVLNMLSEFSCSLMGRHHQEIKKNENYIIAKWAKAVEDKMNKIAPVIKKSLLEDKGLLDYTINSSGFGYTVYVKAGPYGKKNYIGFNVNLKAEDKYNIIRSGVEQSIARYVVVGNYRPNTLSYCDALVKEILSSPEYEQFCSNLIRDLKTKSSDRNTNAYLAGHIEKMKEQAQAILDLGYTVDEVKEIVNEQVIERIMSV